MRRKVINEPQPELWAAIKRLEALSLHGSVSAQMTRLEAQLANMQVKLNLLYKVLQAVNNKLADERLTAIESRTSALDHKFQVNNNRDTTY